MGTKMQQKSMNVNDENDAKAFLKEMEIDVMARTIWGEARGQSQKGMESIAHVILNRVMHAQKRGGTY